MIGILGGMGPQAGFDLASKITSLTPASCDQDHENVVVLSMPSEIEDRTAFLMGHSSINPADRLSELLSMFEALGVDVVAMACNTAHAPPFLTPLLDHVARHCPGLTLLNLIEETVNYVQRQFPAATRIGILGTRATFEFKLYEKALEKVNLVPVLPDESVREECIFPAIYDPAWGIKAGSNPVSGKARELVEKAVVHLANRGAEVVILGCTELPLAEVRRDALALGGPDGSETHTIELVDPAVAMALALLRF